MIKIFNIIGARPQIIKASAISRAIKNYFSNQIHEVIVHTGQHYDHNMSGVFMEELGVPEPDYNLNVGSAAHGKQTALMIEKLEELMLYEKPNCIIIYGDTNSTLAAAIVAAKLNIPIAHVEAGLRSFNKSMPEEINRIVTDHTSTFLFTPTETGLHNLSIEGFKLEAKPPFTIDNPGIFHCGDVMYDNTLYYNELAQQKSHILNDIGVLPNNYILTTIHRPSNTDSKENLIEIINSLIEISIKYGLTIVLPLHPRTRSSLFKYDLLNLVESDDAFKIIPPASFFDITQLEANAKYIITDSGGIQKEAYFFKKPCLILRKETEWDEIIENSAGVLVDPAKESIQANFETLITKQSNFPKLFGDGNAARFICDTIITAYHN